MASNLLSSSFPRSSFLLDKRNFTRPQSPMCTQFPVHLYSQNVYSQSRMHPQFSYPRPQSQYAYSQSPPVYLQSQSHKYTQYAYSQSPMHPQSAYSHPQFHSAYSHPQHDFSQSLRIQKQKHELAKPLRNLGASISEQIDWSLSLAKHVLSTAEAKDTNFVFSPLSMHIVLCMVAAGAVGPTRDQLLDYLKSRSVEELNSLSSQVETLLLADGGPLGGPRLSFADGLWVDQSLNLKPAFKQIVENAYKAAVNQVDFRNKADEVRKEVNAWAEKETNGLIKDLLPPDSVKPDTELILANALYFKGAWADKFDASRTKDGNFFLSNGTPVLDVPFMTSQEDQCICAFDGFKVLKLPYEQGDDNRVFSMYLYLPDTRDGLPALVEKLGSIPGFIESHLPYGRVELGDFRVPKFKIEFGFEASEILKGQGLVLPFSPSTSGGLTEMVDSSPALVISKFVHKASIEVDEEGTEAAAASACRMEGCSMMQVQQKKLDFVAEHPFLFVIREDVSGGVLFVGQLVNPLFN